ncbi:efflux RND transporter periplasmic adaptor subunit [Chryseobacterium shandongense]|uniref:Efflux RND transporter periplasmic adaptor subunit n=1 Tax=Chryseobacterium shandongense TaxID=1493872 RepID=A0AAD0YAU7_9FLAO|nr:efflux RND transporter periplasmic adaptor subunit [Chryseobacterium shandongense]AZA87611.1 efflux RND transporter periplasmic adaptor subunit [Chryseobacterium shandongense]AZA96110.1 efflux RND transporter periplasmic adaptor subunit [Chryseobacterium shandongense]
MKFNINKFRYIMAIIVVLLTFSACKNDKQAAENKSSETKAGGKAEANSEEEMPTIATLTEEQIKMVGIQLGVIEHKELTATIKANGNLKVPNNNKANATSLYGGVIKMLNVQIGDYVKKGQVIATIANPQFIQLQEEYLSTASKISFAEQELARQKELNDGNAGAKKNLQSATAELNSLRTRRASLQQQIQLMGINPGSVSNNNLKSALVVTSPLNGTVSNVFAKIGSYVDVSSPVIEIVDNSSLHLDLQVFEKDLPKIKVGQIIHFTLTNNPTTVYDATVFSIGSSFENESKTIAVHCRVNGNKNSLIDGMNITGIVSLDNITTPAVPNDAIVNADGKYYVFIQTNKKVEEHKEEGEEENKGGEENERKEGKANMNFEKVEVLKGVSDMGYTAITFVNQIPANTKIVVKGAFFVNAKLSNTGEDED